MAAGDAVRVAADRGAPVIGPGDILFERVVSQFDVGNLTVPIRHLERLQSRPERNDRRAYPIRAREGDGIDSSTVREFAEGGTLGSRSLCSADDATDCSYKQPGSDHEHLHSNLSRRETRPFTR